MNEAGPTARVRVGPKTRIALFSVGLALLVGALYKALSGSADAVIVFQSAGEHPAALIALLLLPLVCLALASASFWVLTTRFGKVGTVEMFGLLGGAWLLNFLPLKPGVFGRLAYHKAVNKIDVRWSALVVVQSIFVGVVCFAIQIALALAGAVLELSEWSRAGLIGLPLPIAIVGAIALPRNGATPHWWRFAAAFAFRYADSLVWALRYSILFSLAGRPVGVSGSAAIAGISQSASLVPFAGNGLGVREWLVGFSARILPQWFGDGRDMPVAFGISTELLNRACEVAVAVPLGLVCVWWLWRRFRASSAVSAPGKDTETS